MMTHKIFSINFNISCFVDLYDWRKIIMQKSHAIYASMHIHYTNQLSFLSLKKNSQFTWYRADSRFASCQWETTLQSNAVSHWLGANLESAHCICKWANLSLASNAVLFHTSVLTPVTAGPSVNMPSHCRTRLSALLFQNQECEISHIDGLAQDCGNCRALAKHLSQPSEKAVVIANALELPQPCAPLG